MHDVVDPAKDEVGLVAEEVVELGVPTVFIEKRENAPVGRFRRLAVQHAEGEQEAVAHEAFPLRAIESELCRLGPHRPRVPKRSIR